MRPFVKIFMVALLIMVFLVSVSMAANPDPKRLLLYWTCNETSGDTLKDSSGHGFDAKIKDGKSGWEKGKYDNAVRLQKAYAQVDGDIVSSTAKTGEISLACWVNLTTITTYNGIISIANSACEASCCYRLMINGSKNPYWNAGHHVDKTLANFAFALNTWYHYVLTADGKTDKVYVDGKFIGEQTENFNLPEFKTVSVYLGAGEKPGTWPVENAAFDEVMIWDKALTVDEVNSLMAGSVVLTSVDLAGKLATTWAELKVK
jgi:hypothetical protein